MKAGFLSIKYTRKTDGFAVADLKIIVSLKVSKKAVARNKIKRRIREILRNSRLKPDFDLVIITNREIVGKSFPEIKNRLISELERLNLTL